MLQDHGQDTAARSSEVPVEQRRPPGGVPARGRRTVDRGWGAAWHWRSRMAEALTSERGDVPGWVLVTLMTAAVVAALWLIAEPQLSAMFEDAINSVGPDS
ncbi:hypothetical protein [Cellulomonas composti]|uniref:Uncharacterized protein n=1 Tax=Cellulomonas composti TaxID=266130 RepID=A0A511JBU7_9CELL|nr:hypothetical protein [Cellulomonas composti]GEL95456.1 hypothetical protein CCO02nite_21140 [Cellulomonas composti]